MWYLKTLLLRMNRVEANEEFAHLLQSSGSILAHHLSGQVVLNLLIAFDVCSMLSAILMVEILVKAKERVWIKVWEYLEEIC